MSAISSQIAFSLVALGMVLTPGPNMIYLISRSICQGRTAGLISLGGVALGFVFYMLCAAFGITALLMTVPLAYDALRFAGASYLLFLAWQAVKPAAIAVSSAQFAERFAASPVLYGPFHQPAESESCCAVPVTFAAVHRAIAWKWLIQSLVLCATQIVISISVNGLIVVMAGGIAKFLATRPTWAIVQRWLMDRSCGSGGSDGDPGATPIPTQANLRTHFRRQ